MKRKPSDAYRLLLKYTDVNNYRWLLQQRDKLMAGSTNNQIAALKGVLQLRYPNNDAPVSLDGPLPFTLKELSTAVSAISARIKRDSVDGQAIDETDSVGQTAR